MHDAAGVTGQGEQRLCCPGNGAGAPGRSGFLDGQLRGATCGGECGGLGDARNANFLCHDLRWVLEARGLSLQGLNREESGRHAEMVGNGVNCRLVRFEINGRYHRE